jgi:hypothetical protein
MWSPESLSTLNALASKVGSREAHRLFTSRLRVDTDKANAILAGQSTVCDSCGDGCPVAQAESEAA